MGKETFKTSHKKKRKKVRNPIILTLVLPARSYGRHAAILTTSQIQATVLYYKIASTFSINASSWSKTSFALTMLRITKGRRIRYFIWFVIISVNLTTAGSAMVGWILCRLLRKSWDPLITEGTCWDPKATSNFNVVSSSRLYIHQS